MPSAELIGLQAPKKAHRSLVFALAAACRQIESAVEPFAYKPGSSGAQSEGSHYATLKVMSSGSLGSARDDVEPCLPLKLNGA
jgi:hypothetical protein